MPAQNTQTDELSSDASDLTPSPVSLEYDAAIPATVRARMTYAFRVFAAIYGHAVVDAANTAGAAGVARFRYSGATQSPGPSEAVLIPARYGLRLLSELPPVPQNFADELVPLFLGPDPATGNPDWLGEIFLWLSGELESNPVRRDSVGRIPFSETPFGKYRISPRRPYATLLMAWLENVLRRNEFPALPKAPSPIANHEHLVLPSHDIDFYFSGRGSALTRIAKNLVIAAGHNKSSSYFFDNLRALTGIPAGKRPGEYLLPLLDAARTNGFQSTLFPVVRRAHPRDPNYSLETIAPPVSKAISHGFSLGLHGSYKSVMEDRSLACEAATLGEWFGKRPRANRQHWLRFESQRALFREVEAAGMFSDSSLGFPRSVGFRNGASFAFPPYDFERECPHRFLEIPLVLMDGGLEAEARNARQNAQEIAEEVLNASRKTGWGGISILWHNPIEPLNVPRKINDVFWSLSANRGASQEAWLTFDQFLAAVLPRYRQAGLLEGLSVNA